MTAEAQEKDKTFTQFEDLPNEIVLLICRYLTAAEVLDAFVDRNERFLSCLSKYRQNIDFTKCSYRDFQVLLMMLILNVFQSSTLTVSNVQIPTQLEIFHNLCHRAIQFHLSDVYQISLLEWVESNLYKTPLSLKRFPSLRSLQIVQSRSEKSYSSMNCSINREFRRSLFNSFDTLTELELTTNDGIILHKQFSSNERLKSLIISLQNINDLDILLDGLAPNLNVLHVTICQSNIYVQTIIIATILAKSMYVLFEGILISY